MITSVQIIKEYLYAIGITEYFINESDSDGEHIIFLSVSKKAGPGLKHILGKYNANMQRIKKFIRLYGWAVEKRKNFIILKLHESV